MTVNSPFTDAERIHSLKAAILGGVCAGSLSLLILVAHRIFIFQSGVNLGDLFTNLANLTLLVNGIIAGLSGGVFALTYRYAVRTDNNLQLNLGVVLAFTLVRGLALVDVGSAIAQNFVPFLLACGESFCIFGATAIALTFATQRHWLSPFQ